MIRYILGIPAVFFGDMLIKNKAEKELSSGRQIDILGGNLKLSLHKNKGAMLNAGDSDPERVKRLSLALCILITLLFAASLITGRRKSFSKALSLVLAGAYSNAYDRIKRGYVVDYISFPIVGKAVSKLLGSKAGSFIGGIVFNISDFFIISGCLIAALKE